MNNDLNYDDDKNQIDVIKSMLDLYLNLLKNKACNTDKSNLIFRIREKLTILKFDTIE